RQGRAAGRLRAPARRRDERRQHAVRADGRGGGGLGHHRSRDPRSQPDVRVRAGELGTAAGGPPGRRRGRLEHTAMKVLVIDVGGTNIKVSTGSEPVKIPSGPDMTAARMADEVKKATAGWTYDAVSIGYPGPVVRGRPAIEPKNLGMGWVRFDYDKAFGKPVRVINDAAMQALGSYQGGRMLFLGLGTGLGSAFVADGQLEPLELAHLPYRNNRTYEDYVGLRGYKRL